MLPGQKTGHARPRRPALGNRIPPVRVFKNVELPLAVCGLEGRKSVLTKAGPRRHFSWERMAPIRLVRPQSFNHRDFVN